MNKKISIYQLLPRLFGNNNKKPIINGDILQNGCGKFSDITEKAIQEIKNLGITHIWYTGILRHASTTSYPKIQVQDTCIVKGKAGSPYAIIDYYDVSPDLAVDVENRMNEFDELMSRTRNAGLKTIIDFIPNHVSRNYKSTKKQNNIADLGTNDKSSTHFNAQNNFYYLPNESLKLDFCENQKYQETPAKVSGNDCFNPQPNINDWYETIKLNYGVDVQDNKSKHFYPTPNTWFRMLEILQFWTHKGVDGFRCDMVEMVPVEFWEWVIPQIKKINPEIIFIGEVYQPHLYESYIKQGKFDYLYDKVDLYDKLKQVLRGESPASEISNVWKSLNGLDEYMLRFLENHDEQRIPSPDFASEARKAIPAMLLSATMHQGPVMTYFGQEFGENNTNKSGFSGDDGRTTIFDYWNVPSIQRWRGKSAYSGKALSAEEKNLRKEYQEILKLSISHPAIIYGQFYDLMWANRNNHRFYNNHIYTYFRNYKEKRLLFILNFSDTDLNQNIIIPGHALEFANKKINHLKDICFINIFSQQEIRLSYHSIINDGMVVDIAANGYLIFEF
ncbi:MAG: alpha-amylase [Bacteroidales bacterium]|nr:alpha-amylase [Bacteroidales bacterium]